MLRRAGTEYRYKGTGFSATIREDGSVSFEDRLNLFDLTAHAEKLAGNDPLASQRRTFLNRTAELRRGLERASMRRLLTDGNQRLRRELEQLWNDSKASLSSKKRKMFALWDQCSDDEIGGAARSLIYAFVQQQCPRDSVCAFQTDELVLLNAMRQSGRSFSPYEAVGR